MLDRCARYAYGTQVEHFAWWCREYLVQSVDQFAGRPLELEPWQLAFMGEAMATRDDAGTPVWSSVALVVSRKNGKTSLLAAYALYRLLQDEGSPEILLSASSDKQAGRLFDAVVAFVRGNPELADQVHLREYVGEIARVDGRGKMHRVASDPNTLHGYNPSLVICDELQAWTKPSQRKTWAALTSGGGARTQTQTFTITVAGDVNEREHSILGRLIDGNEAHGEVERHPGLTISRNFPAATLAYNYSAPTTDPDDIDAMMLANPASWITREYLARQAANPELSPAEVLQLHGCVWVPGVNAWIAAGVWQDAFEAGAAIPAGARVALGVDVGIVHDATAVVVAWRRDDGRVLLEARVWTPEGGRNVDLADVEDHVRVLAGRYEVAGLLYDPRFFERSAQTLAAEGVQCVMLPQNSAAMADAYQGFYAGLAEGRVRHAGDRMLTAHVMATAAERTERGWKVRKMRQSQRIDACVAAVMAVYGAETLEDVPAVWVGV